MWLESQRKTTFRGENAIVKVKFFKIALFIVVVQRLNDDYTT